VRVGDGDKCQKGRGERVEEYFNNSRLTIFSKFMIIHRLIVVIIGFLELKSNKIL